MWYTGGEYIKGRPVCPYMSTAARIAVRLSIKLSVLEKWIKSLFAHIVVSKTPKN
jgi:hypothetical protein